MARPTAVRCKGAMGHRHDGMGRKSTANCGGFTMHTLIHNARKWCNTQAQKSTLPSYLHTLYARAATAPSVRHPLKAPRRLKP